MATLPGARRVAWRPLGALVAASFVLASCGGAQYEYVKSDDDKAFFKVPISWEEYGKRELLVATGQSLSAATDEGFPWLVGYDGDPDPSLDHVLELGGAPEHPVILAQVRRLDFSTRDQISLGTLRNVFYEVDTLLQENAADIIDYEELALPDGLRGIRMVFDVITAGATTIAADNTVIRVGQVGVLDAKTENLYVFTIRCESHCYRDNETVIEQIVDSWTVKER
ncbi:MAG TPA: hypothetical protein VGB51_06085 [Actinomycetota bacterium]